MTERDRSYFVEKYGHDPFRFGPLESRLRIYADAEGVKEETSERVAATILGPLARLVARHKRGLARVAECVEIERTDTPSFPSWVVTELPGELRRYKAAIEQLGEFVERAGKYAPSRKGRARPAERALAEAACVADRWIRDVQLGREERLLGSTSSHGYARPSDRDRAETDATLACWPDVVRLLDALGFDLRHQGGRREQAIRQLVKRHRARELRARKLRARCHADPDAAVRPGLASRARRR